MATGKSLPLCLNSLTCRIKIIILICHTGILYNIVWQVHICLNCGQSYVVILSICTNWNWEWQQLSWSSQQRPNNNKILGAKHRSRGGCFSKSCFLTRWPASACTPHSSTRDTALRGSQRCPTSAQSDRRGGRGSPAGKRYTAGVSALPSHPSCPFPDATKALATPAHGDQR